MVLTFRVPLLEWKDCAGAQSKNFPSSDAVSSRLMLWCNSTPGRRNLVARKDECGYGNERRLDHDRANRQEPDLVFRLAIHGSHRLECSIWPFLTIRAAVGSGDFPGRAFCWELTLSLMQF
jgi:hypothetical protein